MVCASKEPSGEEQRREKFKFEPKSACLLQGLTQSWNDLIQSLSLYYKPNFLRLVSLGEWTQINETITPSSLVFFFQTLALPNEKPSAGFGASG